DSFHCTHPTPTVHSTLSLHDALPISFIPRGSKIRCVEIDRTAGRTQSRRCAPACQTPRRGCSSIASRAGNRKASRPAAEHNRPRSEEHTSELQSLAYLVCRLLLEKKK